MRGRALEPSHTTGDKQEPESDDPRPECKRRANCNDAKMGGQRNDVENEAYDPDDHGWCFARVAHGTSRLLVEEKSDLSLPAKSLRPDAGYTAASIGWRILP